MCCIMYESHYFTVAYSGKPYGGHIMQPVNKQAKSITTLLNGTNSALQNVIPIEQEVSKPKLLREELVVRYGVFIGIIGDIKGKILLLADKEMFSSIGARMFGMPIEEEMLASFSGELGNMIAGNVSIETESEGVSIDITEPSIIEGDAIISGYEMAIHLVSSVKDIGDMSIYLLID